MKKENTSMKKIIVSFIILLMFRNAQAGTLGIGEMFKFYSANCMFPDGVKPATDSRYNDNSSIIFIPKGFKKDKPVHFFLWFHGWNNNIESTLEQFKLDDQLYASGINAILVMPEGAKNAQDSYCGQWEKQGPFNKYIEELQQKLQASNIINANTKPDLIIAGHSGAAIVLVKLLQYSTTPIKAALFFDACSAQTDKIATFYKNNPTAKLINLYTNKSSFYSNSQQLNSQLAKQGIGVTQKEDTQFTGTELKSNRILSMHTQLSHNDVATSYHYIERFLKAVE